MQFGLFSESGRRRDGSPAQAFAEDVAEVVLADKLGFREAWIAEPNNDRPTSVTHAHMLMCKAAGLTRQIRFGSGIRQLPLHHPVDVVQQANMCDQVTQGRYMFGYGGTHLLKLEPLHMRGIDVGNDQTRAMVFESIELILKCWSSSEPFDFEGRFWRGTGIQVLPPPFQTPHPPIAAACSGSADTIELAARNGFIPLFGRGAETAQEIRAWGDLYLDAALAAGRRPARRDFHVTRVVYVADTDAQAREHVREGLTQILEVSKREPSRVRSQIPPGGTLDDLTFDFEMDRARYWVGAPDTVYQHIKDYYAASGGFGVLLLAAGQAFATPRRLARSMRLFMRDVAPRLAHLDPDDPAGPVVGEAPQAY